MDSYLKHTKWYQDAGFRIFPVDGKHPLPGLKWQDDTVLASLSSAQWEQATGIGLVVTPGFCVVDIDRHVAGCSSKTHASASDALSGSPDILGDSGNEPATGSCTCLSSDAIFSLLGSPQTPSVATPTGGMHLYLADPNSQIGNSVKAIHPQVDTRGQGKGYVVCPPSVHPNGGTYSWIIPPLIGESFAVVPPQIVSAYKQYKKLSADYSSIFQTGTMIGSRNDTCATLAGALWSMLAKTQTDITIELKNDIISCLLYWDKRNSPPLGIGTITRTVESIGRTHYGNLGTTTKSW